MKDIRQEFADTMLEVGKKNPNLDTLTYVRSKLDNHTFIYSHVEVSVPSVLDVVAS